MKHIKNNKRNVPNLRFPEFSDQWNEYFIRDIAEVTKGSGISKEQRSNSGTPCILYGELYTTYKSEVINDIQSKTNIDATNLVKSKANDVIIPSSGETAIDISTARCVPYDNILLGGDLNIIRLHQNDGRFLSYQLNGVRKLDIARVAQGSSVIHLYGESIKSISVSIPTLNEQQKIVSLLSLIDERIATQNKIIEDLKLSRDAIVEKLFCGNDWTINSYKQIFTISHERNKSLFSDTVLSASQEFGMIERNDLNIDIKYELSSIRNYKIVKKGDYILHLRSFQGGLAYSKMTGICSPAYSVLRPNNKLYKGFLKYFFMSKSFIDSLRIVTYGIRDGRSINTDEFMNLHIQIPDLNTQKMIVEFLDKIELKINFENDYLKAISQQKYYLLKNLFI